MNQKEITSFTATFKPKCDQFNGFYDTKGNDNLAVTTLNVTMEQMFKIYHDEKLMAILNDNNWNVDPTFNKEKQSIKFRIKKLCEWDVEKFYNDGNQQTIKNIQSIGWGCCKISKTYENINRRSTKNISIILIIQSINIQFLPLGTLLLFIT